VTIFTNYKSIEPVAQNSRPLPEKFSQKNALKLSLLVFVISTATLAGLVIFLDHTTNQTANGLWKANNMIRWMYLKDFRSLAVANLVYYPVFGKIARFLQLNHFNWPVWQKVALINCLFGGASLAIFFLLIYSLTRSTVIGVVGTIFHAGCAFFLLLSTICEDIIPAYPFFLLSVLFLMYYVSHPKLRWVILTGLAFSVSWLFHWTMAVGGLSLAAILILASPGIKKRIQAIVVFGVACLVIPFLCSLKSHIALATIIWPGKGLSTGWAGFSAAKIVFATAGIGQYLFGGRNLIAFGQMLTRLSLSTLIFSWLFYIALGALLLRSIRSNQIDPRFKMLTLFLVLDFIFAEMMNLYSQPQDPQMELQPMLWVPVGFSLCLLPKIMKRRLLYLASIPFILNTSILIANRGGDSFAIDQMRNLQDNFRGQKIVMITYGFDPLPAWANVMEESKDWHIVGLTDGVVANPRQIASIAGFRLCRQLEEERRRGYRLIIGPVWDWNESQLVDGMRTVTSTEKPKAIYKALKENFIASPVVRNQWGTFYDLLPNPSKGKYRFSPLSVGGVR
jgi:Dolichyl-phosphate-mannose-protein mannosyltransferase